MADDPTPTPAKKSVSVTALSRLATRAAQRKADLAATNAKLAAANARVAELEKRPTDAQMKAELDDLKGQVKLGNVRKVFDKVAGELKVLPKAMDDVFHALGLKAEDLDGADEAKLKAAVEKVKGAKDYLFEAGDTKPNPKDPLAKNDADRDRLPAAKNASGPSVLRSQLRDEVWMFHNQADAAAAVKAGNVIEDVQ